MRTNLFTILEYFLTVRGDHPVLELVVVVSVKAVMLKAVESSNL